MKKTMKKLAALGLSLTMMMSLAACGNSASEQPAAEPEVYHQAACTPVSYQTLRSFHYDIRSLAAFDGGVNLIVTVGIIKILHCHGNTWIFRIDAMQYLDLETHTWTTENFMKAVQAVYDSGQQNVAAIYCSGQGGDQGTRALINNLYSSTSG